MAHALWVSFLKFSPTTGPPTWTAFPVFQKIKENDKKIEKKSKIVM
jgi:hypothetical protein